MNDRRDTMECRISDQTADETGYWDARLRSPHCTEADRAFFAEWRDACPEHREAFERLQTVLADLRHHMARADVRALRDAALRAEKLRAPRRRMFAAAALVAGLAAATAFWTTLPDRFRHASSSELVAMAESLIGSQQAGVYETGAGQRSTDTLQDGSSVELNARTRIKVVFSENTRTVELIYGQAFFHVAHDARRPFVVRAADREITAVGTQFDVRLDAMSVRVTLIEGNVKVSADSSRSAAEEGAVHAALNPASSLQIPKEGASRDRDIPGESSGTNTIYLTPGQQFVARLSGTARNGSYSAEVGTSQEDALVHTIDIGKVTGWRDGRIYLEDLTLTDAAAEMNRHSPVQISVDDPQIAQLRVNGMFRAGEQEAFVTALEQYFPIAARHRGDTEIILTRRR
jgi:transmembrane sensor